MNVLGVAKGAVALADPYGTNAPRPAIHILKQVVVNGLVVPNAEAPASKRLVRALRRNCSFELPKRRSVTDAGNVLEDRRSSITVRIRRGSVYHSGQWLPCVFDHDGASSLFAGEPHSVELPKVSFHFLRQMDVLKRADLREAAPSKREVACFAGRAFWPSATAFAHLSPFVHAARIARGR
jgi:hypothetical protein